MTEKSKHDMNPKISSNADEMLRQFPNLRYFLKRGNKVVIADDGQSVEHVDGLERGETHQLLFVTYLTRIFTQVSCVNTHAKCMQNHGSILPLLLGKDVLRELMDGCEQTNTAFISFPQIEAHQQQNERDQLPFATLLLACHHFYCRSATST